MSTPETLLKPAKLGPYTLANRMVMAPLSRGRASDGDVPPRWPSNITAGGQVPG